MRIFNVTFDAHDPATLAAFWSAVLERPVDEGANEFYAVIGATETAPNMLFLRVPEGKQAKNRMHLDLACDELVADRSRLEELGATFVHEKDEFGVHWMTFRDPEGNEFCMAEHG